MLNRIKSAIITALSLMLICSICNVFVDQASADEPAPKLATTGSGQATFTTESVYSSAQSAKLWIPSGASYGSTAVVTYPYQKPLNTIDSVQFYTAFTTAKPRCMLYLDVNHDGTTDLALLSDYQMESKGQWKLVTGGVRWGWTNATIKLEGYGKVWMSLEDWLQVYGDATVQSVGIGLEYHSCEPDGYGQPLYVDGAVIVSNQPDPTPTATASVTPNPTPTTTPGTNNTTTPVNITKMLPNISLNCSSSSSNLNFKVNIQGSLTGNGTYPIVDAPILVSYSLSGGDSWVELTFLHTDEKGTFSSVWLPQATGNFLVRAVYRGNLIFQDTNATVSIAVTESDQQASCFTIYSNSTLSELAFDSANRELSFSVSGQDGTSGYVDAFIPESLVGNSIGLNVNLDDKQIHYTAKLENDTWIISFSYHHSTHEVSMKMDATETPATAAHAGNNLQSDWILTASIAVIVATIAVISTALIMKKKNS
jgi:hypothetical protein